MIWNKKYIIAAASIIGVLIALISGWLAAKYYLSYKYKKDQRIAEIATIDKLKAQQGNSAGDSYGSEDALLKIFFINKDSEDGLAIKEIKVKAVSSHLEMAENVITEYLKANDVILKDTKLLGIYRDRNNTIYIDLSEAFRKNFSGDARDEYYLLKSLYKSVISNIQNVDDVKLLIEGKEIESIGGHFSILYGLKALLKDTSILKSAGN